VQTFKIAAMATTQPRERPIADNHVHTEWSWDAPRGSMEASCARAVAMGLPTIAFTDHADFTPWEAAGQVSAPLGTRVIGAHLATGLLDVQGYWECIDRCRARFPALRILSGVELGEAHRFMQQAASVLSPRPFDRVLGSLHCVPDGDALIDMSTPGLLTEATAERWARLYFQELLDLVKANAHAPESDVASPVRFEVLAHLTYPQRFWPLATQFAETLFEDEIREILQVSANSDLILEMNTTRGIDPARGMCPAPRVVRWWHEAGGQAVSFGSDAHTPELLAAGFPAAAEVAERAGFRPGRGPGDFWGRR
jgi:histidinol-phosphatase (PHP family)